MHFRRQKPAIRARRGKRDKWRDKARGVSPWAWLHNWPASWDIRNHRRRPRRSDKRLARAAERSQIDADEVAWPNWRKPHVYYW